MNLLFMSITPYDVYGIELVVCKIRTFMMVYWVFIHFIIHNFVVFSEGFVILFNVQFKPSLRLLSPSYRS